MLEAILGSRSAERVLAFLVARDEGFAREIARFYETGLSPIQRQLEKLEKAGVLAGREAGRTRLYTFDPRYPFLMELKALVGRALEFYPDEMRERLLMVRRRPRREGKPN